VELHAVVQQCVDAAQEEGNLVGQGNKAGTAAAGGEQQHVLVQKHTSHSLYFERSMGQAHALHSMLPSKLPGTCNVQAQQVLCTLSRVHA
jgi:hypothetical protein